MGLSLLAWGNSIGDLVNNIAVSKAGYSNMAVSACFGKDEENGWGKKNEIIIV